MVLQYTQSVAEKPRNKYTVSMDMYRVSVFTGSRIFHKKINKRKIDTIFVTLWNASYNAFYLFLCPDLQLSASSIKKILVLQSGYF